MFSTCIPSFFLCTKSLTHLAPSEPARGKHIVAQSAQGHPLIVVFLEMTSGAVLANILGITSEDFTTSIFSRRLTRLTTRVKSIMQVVKGMDGQF